MHRFFRDGGGSGMGGGSGGSGGMLRTVQRAARAGSGGGPAEPFSASGNTTTVARRNSRNEKNFKEAQPTSQKSALTIPSAAAANNRNSDNNGASPFSYLINLPLSASSGAAAPSWGASSSNCTDDSEWGWVDSGEDGRARVFRDDSVFGTVPSRDEVHHAVSALQQVLGPSSPNKRFPKETPAEDADYKDVRDEMSNSRFYQKRVSSAESEIDWIEPSFDQYDSRRLQPHGSQSHRVYDAFHMLQSEPSVQKMVISLSSDRAVWDAVMNNEVVKELRDSISQADNSVGESPDKGSDDSNPAKDVLSWIIENAKAKIMKMIDSIRKLMNDAFLLPDQGGKGEDTKHSPFEVKLRSSLLLSVVVLLMVVVTRAQSGRQ